MGKPYARTCPSFERPYKRRLGIGNWAVTLHARCTFPDHLIGVHASRFAGLQMPSAARCGGRRLPGGPESYGELYTGGEGFGAVPLGPRRGAGPPRLSPVRRGLAPRAPGLDEAVWGSAGLTRLGRATGRALGYYWPTASIGWAVKTVGAGRVEARSSSLGRCVRAAAFAASRVRPSWPNAVHCCALLCGAGTACCSGVAPLCVAVRMNPRDRADWI